MPGAPGGRLRLPPAPYGRSPRNCFAGDVKRLESHLGLSGGCVRLGFEPPDRFINLEPEVWQDGKRVRDGSSSHRCSRGPADASISIAPVAGPGDKPRYRITTAVSGPDGSSAVTTTWDAPRTEDTRTYFKKLERPVELPEGEPVAVWACLVYKAADPFPPDTVKHGSFEEAAREPFGRSCSR
jgi:hypothetical protein